MPDTHIIVCALVLLVSTLSSMVGIGGGTLYVPLLLTLGFPFHRATALSLFIIVATALSAALTYRRTKKADWSLVLWIEPPTFVMAFVGGYLSSSVSPGVLKGVLIAVLLASGYLLLRPVRADGLSSSPNRRGMHRRLGDREYWVNLAALMPATALAGLLAGMEGISGGVLKVPAMVLLGGVPVDIAVASSELMVAATATVGLLGHVVADRPDLALALPLGIVASLGGWIGAQLAMRVGRRRLQWVLAAMLLLATGQLLWEALATAVVG